MRALSYENITKTSKYFLKIMKLYSILDVTSKK